MKFISLFMRQQMCMYDLYMYLSIWCIFYTYSDETRNGIKNQAKIKCKNIYHIVFFLFYIRQREKYTVVDSPWTTEPLFFIKNSISIFLAEKIRHIFLRLNFVGIWRSRLPASCYTAIALYYTTINVIIIIINYFVIQVYCGGHVHDFDINCG